MIIPSEVPPQVAGGRLSASLLACLLLLLPSATQAQADNTVTYPASYFQQWNPVTVADMIDRIPGISIALDDNSSSRGQNDRGLGSNENILINGRRLSGKDNDASAQLDRIPFDQVSHIEILRGTSGDLLGIRNDGQIVNIVTTTNSEVSLTLSSALYRFQDGSTEPGGSVLVNGNTDALEYRLSVEQSPEYQVVDTIEESIYGVGDFSPNDLRQVREITDQSNRALNSSLSYEIGQGQNLSVNLQYAESDPPKRVERTILDFDFQPPAVFRELENNLGSRDSWELGADYNLALGDDSQLQLLAIINEQDQDILRQRFRRTADDSLLQDLSLRNQSVDSEQIYRAVYTFPLRRGQDLELGLERAQTTLETELDLARLNPLSGELISVPVPNADSEIEEIRYEGFVVHHWQLNPEMQLESTLLYEISEISQSGDVNRSRDFNFLRPKLDYRYNISSNLQWQLSVEKFVAQLRFADFAANTDPRDEDRDTVAGNPELRQQQSWRYTTNLEYRFLETRGVLNARAWYWDVSDAIGRVDVSEPGGPLASAAGNIGDGWVKAIQLNASFRITPNLLLSGTALARASEVTDPFSGVARRLVPNDRGFHSLSLRHDLPDLNLNYGIDYFGAPQGNRPLFDIDRVDHLDNREDLSLFVERNSLTPLGLVLRLEASNILDRGMCSDRFRFDDRLSVGRIAEIERRCSERGSVYSVSLRGTF